MTARHSFPGDRTIKVCDDTWHPGCGALVWGDGPLEGRDVDTDHKPRHDFTVPWPYVLYRNGVLVAPELDDVRDAHDVRFPITGGLYDGYRLGGRA
jgi:hypothetical protein